MSSIGRRQAGADQEKFDLSKKTIRDVAAELARRGQPPVSAGSVQPGPFQQPVAPTSLSGAALSSVAERAVPAGQNSAAPSAGGSRGQEGEGDQPPSNLVQMDPRPAPSPTIEAPSTVSSSSRPPAGAASPPPQFAPVPSFLWTQHRPFTDDSAGPVPLEALSRALDHRQVEQPDNIALTPSSMMTTDLAPPPLVVAPSAAHPTVDGARLPLQESPGSMPRREARPGHQAIRHYPSRHLSPLTWLRSAWLRHSLRRTGLTTSMPLRSAGVDWSTLVLGVGIGLLVGAGVIAILQPSSSSRTSGPRAGLQRPEVRQPDLPASTPRSVTTPTIAGAPPSSTSATPAQALSTQAPSTQAPVLPVAPSAAGSPAVGSPTIGSWGLPPAAPRLRDMTATTFGIPAALQPANPPASGGIPTPASADGQKAKTAAAVGGSGSTAKPAAATQRPAKSPAKAKAKPAQTLSSGQHAPGGAATERLSPAKR
jgi:hypothetical protein